jgi:D-psicose/D-tagatose/L-ribulose 3-epimerase
VRLFYLNKPVRLGGNYSGERKSGSCIMPGSTDEPVNRYETYLINTCDQALKMIDLIAEDNVFVHLDTYHMNIEEKSFYEATRKANKKLIHYHLCENDRGIPGTGLVDWDGIFRALKEIDYFGFAALESFVDSTDNMNTWVWRQLAPDGDTLLQEGVAFIRRMQAKYHLNLSFESA